MKELNAYDIDPLTLNGTEPYTELTIDQLIMRAMGGIGGRYCTLAIGQAMPLLQRERER